MIEQRKLFRVANSPEFAHPAYVIYARDAAGHAHERSIEGLRLLAAQQARARG